jgi:hypothetical protein
VVAKHPWGRRVDVQRPSDASLRRDATKLNLVAGNTEVYNSYSGGGGNEGGYYSHVDGHVSPWSPDYSTRPIGPAGLAAEGGPSGDTFACDNDGFGCFVYNRQAFDNVLSDGLNTAALNDGGEPSNLHVMPRIQNIICIRPSSSEVFFTRRRHKSLNQL